MDVLSDILSTLRLRGTVYFEADFRAPWGMDMKGGAVANFHLVVEGCCWLRGPGDSGLRTLHKGDLVVLPHGDRHALLHAPDAEAKPAEAVVDLSCDSSRARPEYGGDGDATTLICGHFAYERAGMHPLIEALPSVIHLASDQQKWINNRQSAHGTRIEFPGRRFWRGRRSVGRSIADSSHSGTRTQPG